MPPLDWDKLMAAKPTELSEEDVEEFYESLVSFNPEDESDTRRLQKLFDVSRVIMKAKNELCKEIMEEFEKEVKANVKQNMAMASKEKELQKKIKELERLCLSYRNMDVRGPPVGLYRGGWLWTR